MHDQFRDWFESISHETEITPVKGEKESKKSSPPTPNRSASLPLFVKHDKSCLVNCKVTCFALKPYEWSYYTHYFLSSHALACRMHTQLGVHMHSFFRSLQTSAHLPEFAQFIMKTKNQFTPSLSLLFKHIYIIALIIPKTAVNIALDKLLAAVYSRWCTSGLEAQVSLDELSIQVFQDNQLSLMFCQY